ncbi:threonine ammonia-lyase, biosynthetic [Moraxella catarrhalis]|uniref:L-threonine dehydratase n=1 Tax=Moraxella catarrhalis TaxID=480 RepID=A0AB36DQ03_MORCA|nr:threonine ammonia-lyase, biosynthetic [Moraxella catarrhalis]MPX28566.1 threonine ammonia-lyase, biosynthetic [Moraxella catarrhalis]OAV26573.1 Threonine dehydratase biosynthetic [Moraxella catarrhalis]RKL86443.1 threonine ammonia-lyase, biosynthetic [Moraxella catarrhalis]RKL87165.1 threonine ammonia-lyase, biosynthetic [Moraxella catarrhalis]RKL96979.1 threonine ammonia-lyase, biosynthetic [Moraxella catarrhalis]
MLTPYVRAILQATVYDVAIHTPLEPAAKLSKKFDNHIRLKREDLQPVFSFKLRGAYNKISQLSDAQKQKGIICASAGNHAQGVAYSANRLGINNLIIMPTTTPDIKVQAVKSFGGTVHLHGDSFDEANRFAMHKAETDGMTYIAPYDDELVIAGQGTIGLELTQQWRNIDYVFIACGGGGLLAGVAAFLGEVAPHIKVVAVEPEGAACLKAALASNKRIRLPQVSLFADGVAVAQIGELPYQIAKLSKSDGSGTVIEPEVVTCTNDEICAAIKDIFEENRSIVETAGALSVAGMKKFIQTHNLSGKNCVAIISGANMNFDRLRYIAERTEIGEQKEAIFAVQLPEKTGAFLDFCRVLQGRNITEFNYRMDASNPNTAHVFVGIGLKEGQKERSLISDTLVKNGYTAYDLTDDEAAKTHIRYLIGGHANLEDERLFRVIFPERPGALLNFLEKLGQDFNITLFHYRNHGAAEGRILVGLQASHSNSRQILDALTDIGYECQGLTEDVGYQLFLK